MIGAPGGTGRQDMPVRTESRGQQTLGVSGPEPRPGPVQAIGVELGPSGEPRPCGGAAKSNQVDPASDPGGRSVRCDFLCANTCGVLEYSVGSRPRPEVERRRGPFISLE